MMCAHVLYYEGKTFAIVEDEGLWLKGSKDTEEWYLVHGSKKFRVSRPRGLAVNKSKEGKKQYMNYFYVPQEIYEDKEKREEWLSFALSVAKLPGKKK